ncbi:MAG: intradiol ring-cleavage dioxygenase [Acidobacteriota bacterium]
MIKNILILVIIGMLISISCQQKSQPTQNLATKDGKHVGGDCEGCEGIYEGMPKEIGWETTIPDTTEPGQPIEISGTIFKRDGKTPAANVILYVYHTDNKGYYTPAENTNGWTRRHGHLRSWMRTNERGEYKFRTIKPIAYPNRDIPAHIHPIIKEPDKNEYFIDEYLFDDDPLLTSEKRKDLEDRGGNGIIHLEKGSDGILRGKRDIILGLNIPNY